MDGRTEAICEVAEAPSAAEMAEPLTSPIGDLTGQATAPTRTLPECDPAVGWWRAWRTRFGLAEVCGTIAGLGGFAAGYLIAGSLVTAAGLATVCELIGFYACVGAKTALAAYHATAHYTGWRRLGAGAWHAVREQLMSCVVAEVMDDFLIRPGSVFVAAALLQPLPGGVWLGYLVGKATADVAWYGMEALVRRGVTGSRSTAAPATPYLLLDLARATDNFRELNATLSRMTVHYAVKANPHPRLLAALHRAGCRFEAASWAEIRAVMRVGTDPSMVLFTHPVKSTDDIVRAWKAGVWRFAADSATELHKLARHAPGAAVLVRLCTETDGALSDQGKFGVPLEEAVELMRLAASLGLKPYGLAFHVGSQKMDPYAWDEPVRESAEIMRALTAHGIRLEMLDVGGGFPVRYDVDPPPLADYRAAIDAALADLPYPVQVVCEPGRAIAATAGTMVGSVIGATWRRGTWRVGLDVGAFHGLIEALESGRELRFPVDVPAAGSRTLAPCTLTGPSCDSQDTILDLVWLPTPTAGDRVLIGNAGAYTTCYSGSSSFNGYPAPAVRLVGTLRERAPRPWAQRHVLPQGRRVAKRITPTRLTGRAAARSAPPCGVTSGGESST